MTLGIFDRWRRTSILFLKHDSSIIRQSSNPACGFSMMEHGTALCCLAHGELAWLFHEPHTGLDDCLNMLLSRFRKRMSGGHVLIFQVVCHTFAGVNVRAVPVICAGATIHSMTRGKRVGSCREMSSAPPPPTTQIGASLWPAAFPSIPTSSSPRMVKISQA